MTHRRAATLPGVLRTLPWLAAVVLAGVVAFVVTVNRTALPARPPSARAPTATLVEPSPTPSLDDLARAVLSRTVTIESLAGSSEGLGTGWLLDGRGDFVTNAHVVQGSLAVRIRGRDGSSHVGVVVGADSALDVAVVRSRDGFRGAPLVPFTGVLGRLPEPVVIIASGRATGHADITAETLTRVAADVPVTGDTATGQPPTTADYHSMLVLDGATVHPGNSGGPVLDEQGRVIGIVTLASRSLAEGYAIQIGHVLSELLGFAAR